MDHSTSLLTILDGAEPRLAKVRHFVIAVMATFLILYHLYVGILGPPPGYVFKAVHLGAAQMLAFLIFPMLKKKGSRFYALDLACTLVTLFITVYILWLHEDWHLKIAGLGALDFSLGCAMILLIWEATVSLLFHPLQNRADRF